MATVEHLAAAVRELSAATQLRLAADLLERKKPELAQALAQRVADELGLAIDLARIPRVVL